ncbi:MAG: hypothetical protein NTAFB01_01780 [Nitrospira sp.]
MTQDGATGRRFQIQGAVRLKSSGPAGGKTRAPRLGMILCSKKNEAIAKYSVLREARQIFAAKYQKHLPSELELQREVERERRLIDARRASGKTGHD